MIEGQEVLSFSAANAIDSPRWAGVRDRQVSPLALQLSSSPQAGQAALQTCPHPHPLGRAEGSREMRQNAHKKPKNVSEIDYFRAVHGEFKYFPNR